MNHRWLINAILAAIIMVMAVLLLLRPGLEQPVPPPRLTSIDVTRIRHIEVHAANQPAMIFEAVDSGWRIHTPLKGRANPYALATIMHAALASIKHQLPRSATHDLARFGLDHPRMRLVLGDTTLYFGDINRVGQSQYVQYKNDIYLIDASHYWAIMRPAHDFLSPALIEHTRTPTAWQLPAFSLEKIKGSWRLKPANDRIPSDRITQLAKEWQHAQALIVRPYSGMPAIGHIQLSYVANDKPMRLKLVILSRKNMFILYRPDEGLEYHFPEDVGLRLTQLEPAPCPNCPK